MYCSNCGTKVEQDSKFCEKCGSSMTNLGESNGDTLAISNEKKALINIKLSHFPLAIYFKFCNPQILVDDKLVDKGWGSHKIDIKPGKHNIKVYFKYLFMSQCGYSSIDIDIKSDETLKLKYTMPAIIVMKGKLKKVK
ncbi:MAG: zinc-ribbon domain-containing protein [Tissierellaceae bacterium]|nr:zinc-ribbon domain-containing protein [Tissierellaceae bacterium]